MSLLKSYHKSADSTLNKLNHFFLPSVVIFEPYNDFYDNNQVKHWVFTAFSNGWNTSSTILAVKTDINLKAHINLALPNLGKIAENIIIDA
jgi:hypothetical protein